MHKTNGSSASGGGTATAVAMSAALPAAAHGGSHGGHVPQLPPGHAATLIGACEDLLARLAGLPGRP